MQFVQGIKCTCQATLTCLDKILCVTQCRFEKKQAFLWNYANLNPGQSQIATVLIKVNDLIAYSTPFLNHSASRPCLVTSSWFRYAIAAFNFIGRTNRLSNIRTRRTCWAVGTAAPCLFVTWGKVATLLHNLSMTLSSLLKPFRCFFCLRRVVAALIHGIDCDALPSTNHTTTTGMRLRYPLTLWVLADQFDVEDLRDLQICLRSKRVFKLFHPLTLDDGYLRTDSTAIDVRITFRSDHSLHRDKGILICF